MQPGKQICDGFLVNPDSGEQVVNLWRVNEFAGGTLDVSVEKADLNTVRDLVAQGTPRAALACPDRRRACRRWTYRGGDRRRAMAGNPDSGSESESCAVATRQLFERICRRRPELDRAIIGGGPAAPAGPGQHRFLLAAVSQPPTLLQNFTLDAQSIAGACSLPVDLTDSVDVTGTLPAGGPRVSRFVPATAPRRCTRLMSGRRKLIGPV